MAKIVHLTSAHPRYDTRIFLKMCRSLAAHGHWVSLVVADGLGNEERDGVHIIDVGRSPGRLARMLGAPRRVMQRGIALDADVYQLHDPELLPVGLTLARRGKTVVYDAHEDFPAALLSKHYIPLPLRRLVSWSGDILERVVGARLAAVIGATPHITAKFSRRGLRTANINNFPMTGELFDPGLDASVRDGGPVYVGGFGRIRGLVQLVDAMALARTEKMLTLAGKFDSGASQEAVVSRPGWKRVNPVGSLSREQVKEALATASCGVVTFLAEPNHVTAQPNKMFEYMSSGTPVIASDFPLWREIVEGADCGICVDPLDPRAIAAAIDHFVENPDKAYSMGQNGRRAVLERYNWAVEEKKLLDLYDSLIQRA